ncbi:MAG TPA: glutamate racemase [Fibrobacteraceae bacterium]|nr:glutamate racemase [Fibrobacteraceae bacterium]
MIGVFDSGFGGLTVLRELVRVLPSYDFLYLGDNARAPYGSRSFEAIHRYTWEAVNFLFSKGCPLVILACNTASARALRTIQNRELIHEAPDRRVLGVLRPVTEIVGKETRSGHIAILGTQGTVRSCSYPLEIAHFWPNLVVSQQACPMWVPLVENGELDSEGARFFVHRDLRQVLERDPLIDLMVMGCTHYPLLMDLARSEAPKTIHFLNQGKVVANRTVDYLQRHPEMDARMSKNSSVQFLTTDTVEHFENGARLFFGSPVQATQVKIG